MQILHGEVDQMQTTIVQYSRRILSLVAASLLLAGCTAGGQVPPEARLIQVADRMDQLKTAHFTSEGQVSVQPLPPAGAAPGGGETQQPATERSFSAEGDLQFPNRQQAKVTVTDAQSSVSTSVVRVGDEVWVYDPQQRSWIEGTVNITDQLQQLDPVRTVGLLRVASQDLKTIGQEQIGGVQTTHLQAVLEPTRARELIIRGSPELANYLERVDGTIDMWITDDNLLNQIHPDLAFTVVDPAQTEGQRTRVNTNFTVKLSNFDAPLNIEAPQVTNGSQQAQPTQPSQPMPESQGQGQTMPNGGMNSGQ